MNALKHRQLKHALPLIAALSITFADAAAATAVHEPSVLATEDQRAVESRAIQVFASPRVKAEIAKSRARFLASPLASDPEARATVDKAVHELAFAATLDAVNGDPSHPRVVWAFTPPRKWLGHEVPGSRWGIDNPDNVYRFAPVDNASRYELKVRPTASQQAPVQYSFLIYDSFVGEDGRQNNLDSPVAALRAQDIEAEPDGSFTVTIDSAPAGNRPNHLQTNANARVLLIRNTFSDWNSQSPQAVSIKRLDGPAAGKPRDDAAIAQDAVRLIQAGTETLLGWQEKGFASTAKPNTVAPPFTRGGGWGFAATGNYRLAADEALVVQLDHASARYVGFDLTDQWLVSRDHIEASGSLNNTQAKSGTDGTYTYVIAAHDPGVANWLDTGGLHAGKFLIRWQALQNGGDAKSAVRSVQVLKLSALQAQLAQALSTVTPAARKVQSRVRAESYARRYLQTETGAPLVSVNTIN
jgi:hypothetical protein